MPLKCYNKPNRKRPRVFKMCDAARIAREVVRDNEDTPEEVLACIAKGLGFAYISLSRQTSLQSGFPEVIKALPVLLGKLIPILQLLAKRYAWLIPFIKNILVILDKAKTLFDKLIELPDQMKVDDAVGGKCNCKKETSSTPLLIKHRLFPGPS